MAYTPHNFSPGDTLSAEIFNELEQTVHDLGGSMIDIKEYIVAENALTYNCTFTGETETSYLFTQQDTTSSLSAYCAIFSLGTFGDIKDKTYYFKFKDLTENPESLINKVDLHIAVNKEFNYGKPIVKFDTASQTNAKSLTFERNMADYAEEWYALGATDETTAYLVIPITKQADIMQTVSFSAYYIRSEFVDGATGNGEYKDVKYYYNDAVKGIYNATCTMPAENTYELSCAGGSNAYFGCSFPLDTYGALKDKKIGIAITDDAGFEEIGGLGLFLRKAYDFNVTTNIVSTIRKVSTGAMSPYTIIVDMSTISADIEDDEMLYILLYTNYSSTYTDNGSPNVLLVQTYYLQKEWVESGADLTDYYTKEETDEAISKAAGGTYSKYKLYSIGDSLCQGGVWQTECASRLGCTFDETINVDPSYPTSVGGSTSSMSSSTSTFFRTMNLINYGGITNLGERAIIIMQNNNDSTFTFDPEARTYFYNKDVEVTELTEETLGAIPEEDRTYGTVLKLLQNYPGRVLTVDTLPTIEGDVKLRVGWSGPGYSDYYIHVVPQATDEETLQYIYDRIIEYDFKGVYDESYDDGTVSGVSFCSGVSDTTYLPLVQFTDTDGTGMTCTVTDVESVPFATYRWFNSDDFTQWTTPSLWIKPAASSGWKSSIEALLKAFPKAKIALFHFPQITQTQANFLKDDGLYDEVAFFNAVDPMNQTMIQRYKDIANLYRLKFIDLYSICGITATNLTTFYPEKANVHPSTTGQLRLGELMAGEIQGWIKQ